MVFNLKHNFFVVCTLFNCENMQVP